MKRINWIGPERMIPNYGTATAGRELTLPDKMADSFVAQGLAEYADLEQPEKAVQMKLESKSIAEESSDE